MHLGAPALLDFYRNHRDDDALVLATIIGTVGSTYRKPGAMMLIAGDGSFEGLISGGCLEGDLLHHAAEVLADGCCRRVTYDLHADDDLVWSLGLGCDGVIHLQLQRLAKAQKFGFLGQLEASLGSRMPVLLALATSSDGEVRAGAHAVLDGAGAADGEPTLLDILRVSAESWPGWRFKHVRFGRDLAGESILIHFPAATRVLVCGAGPDAVPLVEILAALGWEVVVADHRPAFARADRFPEGCTVLHAQPDRLAETFDLSTLDAAVIMSHHLEHDGSYLRGLAALGLPYIGVLGPRARRLRLAQAAGCPDLRLFGPAGLDIGAELPASIALAIAAEMHAVLNERDGTSLTGSNG
jgi:xanthine/CO dehydrogenase XdhC/CoxF family maturation factor